MTVYLYDLIGNEHKISCYTWDAVNDRYVFYDEKNHTIAVFQKDNIIGFTVERE